MMAQKILIASLTIWLAVSVASVLKFTVRKKLNVFVAVLSFFIPLLLVRLMIKVNVLFWKDDLNHFSLVKKLSLASKFMLFQTRFAPSIHTIFIDGICRRLKENADQKNTTTYFKTDEKTMADVRGMIYSKAMLTF
ncbi:MAG: hypothetical protein IJ774_07785 [Selenomonadaceae bacterium]|nr:hypothetical protein [Selenomonadaceae bacterium]